MSQRLHHIQHSKLTPTQKMDMLQTTTLTAALYPITLCNFPLTSIASFDKLMRKFFKHTWRLPKGTASDILHIPTNLLGLGAPRMLPLIAQKLGVQLTEALADKARLAPSLVTNSSMRCGLPVAWERHKSHGLHSLTFQWLKPSPCLNGLISESRTQNLLKLTRQQRSELKTASKQAQRVTKFS
jgi:hypothetical protein